MTRIVILSIAIAIGACSAPEELVTRAADECAMIGFDLDRERVPTLECTERGYRISKQKQSAPLTSIAIGVAVAGAASAVQ